MKPVAFCTSYEPLINLKLKVPHRLAVVDQLFQRVNAYFKMRFYKVSSDLFITFFCFYPFWNHGLVADQEQSPRGNFVIKPY